MYDKILLINIKDTVIITDPLVPIKKLPNPATNDPIKGNKIINIKLCEIIFIIN